MLKLRILLLILSSLAYLGSAQAKPLTEEQVPKPLKPWIDWVLHDQTQLNCPYAHASNNQECAWPSQLKLSLSETGGTFNQQWQVYAETFVLLPGNEQHWPQNIKNGQTDLLVQTKNGLPYVKLAAGKHTITGQFYWKKLPKSLLVTPQSGLIQLRINNQQIDKPQFKGNGQLLSLIHI